jgi:hypothetical protein
MKSNNETKSLPKNRLRVSKRMTGLSLLLVAAGITTMMGPWSQAVMAGLGCAALGFGFFFTAGYYWGCDNESCS